MFNYDDFASYIVKMQMALENKDKKNRKLLTTHS